MMEDSVIECWRVGSDQSANVKIYIGGCGKVRKRERERERERREERERAVKRFHL